MKKYHFPALFLLLSVLLTHARAQTASWQQLSLSSFSAFATTGANWQIASDARADYLKTGDMKAVPGEGVAVNIVQPANNAHLVTKEEFGDIELELDFMMAKGSNSGVYLQGRYEVQLFDSWAKQNPTYTDCGAIYQRWNEAASGHEGYEGIPPLTNVAKAPGLWQHLHIFFRAPKFDANGNKIANARFEQVYLNGVAVQQGAAVTGPTRSSMFQDEKPNGPFMLQGDHGNVAFKNIRYRVPAAAVSAAPQNVDPPILINPENKPYLLRSFLMYGNTKLTHTISVGSPFQLHYSYDLKEGALFQAWRGQYLDVTDMWHERGEPQLAKPTGSVIPFSDAPVVAILADSNATWPDSVAFDDFNNKGYSLDSNRYPIFRYEYNGIKVLDKIFPQSNGQSLIREINIAQPPANLYCRVAAGNSIEILSTGLYALNDKQYYISLDPNLHPVIRTTSKGKELVVAYPSSSSFLSYSIIW